MSVNLHTSDGHCLHFVSNLLFLLYPLSLVHPAHLHVCYLQFSKISLRLHLHKCALMTIVSVPDRRCKAPSDMPVTRNGPQIPKVRHLKHEPNGRASALQTESSISLQVRRMTQSIHTSGLCFSGSLLADRRRFVLPSLPSVE